VGWLIWCGVGGGAGDCGDLPGGLRGSKVPHLALSVVILDRHVGGHQGLTGR